VSAESAYVYFDARFLRGQSDFPVTDGQHADGTINAVFARCTYCHAFPPQRGRHESHVLRRGKQCYECHFGSVASDTLSSSAGAVPAFRQRGYRVPGGDTLPSMKPEKHMNGRIDVMFRLKYESAPVVDSVFRWNPADNSCSNVGCHSIRENRIRAVWKEITE
jgi:hypothetical protein